MAGHMRDVCVCAFACARVAKILLEPTGGATVVVNSTYQRPAVCRLDLDSFWTSILNLIFRHILDFRRLKSKIDF